MYHYWSKQSSNKNLFAPSIISCFQLCVLQASCSLQNCNCFNTLASPLPQSYPNSFHLLHANVKQLKLQKSHYFLTSIPKPFLPVLPHLPFQNTLTNSDISKDSKPSNKKNWTYSFYANHINIFSWVVKYLNKPSLQKLYTFSHKEMKPLFLYETNPLYLLFWVTKHNPTNSNIQGLSFPVIAFLSPTTTTLQTLTLSHLIWRLHFKSDFLKTSFQIWLFGQGL
jgi:hypothetical protein